MYHNFVIHSFVCGHLGCRHVRDTAKNTDISRACETKSRMQGWMNSVQDKGAGGKPLEAIGPKSLRDKPQLERRQVSFLN